MTKPRLFSGLIVLTLILGLAAGPLDAQEASQKQGAEAGAGAKTDAIQTAAGRLFKALADGDVSVVAQNTVTKYITKLQPDRIRMPATGPKLKAAFDGQVKVLRSGQNDAVVEARLFTPDSSDVPVGEVSRVRIYMVQQAGEWKASAADKKEDGQDADINGGWYHAAGFTFCPNRGFIFTSNHFSREIDCAAVAQCARF
jgi:hypothetical protein